MKFSMFLSVGSLLLVLSCNVSHQLTSQTPSWEENFNDGHLDTTVWSRIPRGNADWNRHMSDFDSCYGLRNGRLVLRGIANHHMAQDTAPFITGGIYSKDKKTFDLGRLEIRAKLGKATGAWPAFWLLAQDARYPDGGEIDIMEHLNRDSIVYQTVHSYYTITLNKKNEPPHGGIATIHPDDFNIYAVEKYQDSVVFFVNGKRTFAYPRISTKEKDQFPYTEKPHYLLLDMQLGGSWVGKVDPQQLPVEMEIDWVRFYAFKK